jgi:hypothetical protein
MRLNLKTILCAATITFFGAILVTRLWAWGAAPHSYIIDAALTTIPPEDHLAFRLGNEARHLRNTVQMADWQDTLVVANEDWRADKEDYPLVNSEFFGDDYLLFPSAPHTFDHSVPGVKDTYRPFFLRALQALRTEDSTNAARWMGSLLHFVTDSGSPPHTIGLHGENHTRMENWLDASKIDLSGYRPILLGRTDEEAVVGLQKRMDYLIARNARIARLMIPFAEASDRAHVEPMALDCATETAKVAADVIHTLMVLSAASPDQDSGSILASISAPPLSEHRLLPAKLVLLGTNYSTLSETSFVNRSLYSGTFSLVHLPPGSYRAAIERPGSETLFTPEFSVHKGEQTTFSWTLNPSGNNLIENPDFRLRWVANSIPDHWHYSAAKMCWLSDNIPVLVGGRYLVSIDSKTKTSPDVHLEWMANHWQTTDDPTIEISEKPAETVAPSKALYARFCIKGLEAPFETLNQVSFIGASQ